jgi:hypothetical protein
VFLELYFVSSICDHRSSVQFSRARFLHLLLPSICTFASFSPFVFWKSWFYWLLKYLLWIPQILSAFKYLVSSIVLARIIKQTKRRTILKAIFTGLDMVHDRWYGYWLGNVMCMCCIFWTSLGILRSKLPCIMKITFWNIYEMVFGFLCGKVSTEKNRLMGFVKR